MDSTVYFIQRSLENERTCPILMKHEDIILIPRSLSNEKDYLDSELAVLKDAFPEMKKAMQEERSYELNLSLQEISKLFPGKRVRLDAYKRLQRFLSTQQVTLNLTSRKTKKTEWQTKIKSDQVGRSPLNPRMTNIIILYTLLYMAKQKINICGAVFDVTKHLGVAQLLMQNRYDEWLGKGTVQVKLYKTTDNEIEVWIYRKYGSFYKPYNQIYVDPKEYFIFSYDIQFLLGDGYQTETYANLSKHNGNSISYHFIEDFYERYRKQAKDLKASRPKEISFYDTNDYMRLVVKYWKFSGPLGWSTRTQIKTTKNVHR